MLCCGSGVGVGVIVIVGFVVVSVEVKRGDSEGSAEKVIIRGAIVAA